MKALKTIYLAVLFILMSSAFSHSQTTYIVDQGGTGNFTTITAAATNSNTALVNGDTIKVMKGVYSETNIQVNKRIILIAQDSTELRSSTGSAIVFNASASGSVMHNFLVTGNSSTGTNIYVYWTTGQPRTAILNNTVVDGRIMLEGPAIAANNSITRTSSADATQYLSGIWCDNNGTATAHVVIFNNTLRNCGIEANYAYCDVISNRIHAFIASFGEGIIVTNNSNPKNVRIIGNVVDSCVTGIYSYGSTNVTISNNLITNCTNGINSQNSSTILSNNVVYNATSKAFATNVYGYFYGNIFANCAGTFTIQSAIFDYNCFYNIATVPAGISNITDDPLFTDAAGGNFTLQGGSPCINTGNPNVVYTDIDKTRNDMGIYGGSTTVSNYNAGTNPKVIDLTMTPTSVIQGNTITITGTGISK